MKETFKMYFSFFYNFKSESFIINCSYSILICINNFFFTFSLFTKPFIIYFLKTLINKLSKTIQGKFYCIL